MRQYLVDTSIYFGLRPYFVRAYGHTNRSVNFCRHPNALFCHHGTERNNRYPTLFEPKDRLFILSYEAEKTFYFQCQQL